MKKSKKIIIIAIIVSVIVGLTYNLLTGAKYEHYNSQNGINLESVNTNLEYKSTTVGTSNESSVDLYDNNLLDAMEYLGVNIDWLRDNNLLYTEASTAPAFLKAGGAGGNVPGYDNLKYPKNVSLYIRYNAGWPESVYSNGAGVSLGDETTKEGLPDINYFKKYGWPCNSFPNYYYFNYLPNVAGVDTSWMLNDRYFYEFKNFVWWEYPETYCWVNGWREALDRMAADTAAGIALEDTGTVKVTRYCCVEWSGLNSDGKGYSSNVSDIVKPNVDSKTSKVIVTGKSVYDYLSPGDVVIFKKNLADGKIKTNSHIGIYAGSANGYHYIADMSQGKYPEYDKVWGTNEGRVGFVTTAYYALGFDTKGDAIDTWYHFDKDVEEVSISVTKKWEDDSDRDGKRPESIKLTLYADGVEKETVEIKGTGNTWTYTFKNLPKYNENGTEIEYTVDEKTENVPSGYTKTVDGSTITNTREPEFLEIKITKAWEDNNNLDDLRPESITVKLMTKGKSETEWTEVTEWFDENGNKVTVPSVITIDAANNWTFTTGKLYKYENGELKEYKIEEINVPDGYEVNVSEGEYQFTITNTHEPHYDGYFEITGKVWLDGAVGKGNDINGTYGSEDLNNGKIKLEDGQEVKVRLKDASGNLIASTYIYKDKDKDGKAVEVTSTECAVITNAGDGSYTIRVNYDNRPSVYKLYKNAEDVRKALNTAYVEFEYDGFKYTTVATSSSGANTSKAIENESVSDSTKKTYSRNEIDSNTIVTPTTSTPGKMPITAITKNVISFEEYVKVEGNVQTTKRSEVIKYCNGDGTYTRTHYNGAWNDVETKSHTCTDCEKGGHKLRDFKVEVNTIQHVNLGLFEREQPGLIVTSDINNVQVTMNGQQYTYYYNIESDKYSDADVKVKFQNKINGENQEYTYKRPMNPADIAYIQNNQNALEVLVTYDVKVGNYSTTLPITINKVINAYDSNYTIVSVQKGNSNINYTESNYYKEDSQFEEIILNGLNITVQPGKEAKGEDIIKITYSVNINAIKEKLLNGIATLDNAVEIGEYSTQYGEDTLYAEGRKNSEVEESKKRKSYGGYDYVSHPGNAGIYVDGTFKVEKPEPDTDIAPSFALVNDKEKTKILSGTVWEDIDVTENEERVGNGKQDDSEKKVQKVRVELYNMDGTLAKLYNEDTKKLENDASVLTNADGGYALEGVVTGEYFIKYTYGENSTIDGGETTINARNYKSTIIKDQAIIDKETNSKMEDILKKDYVDFSESEKIWHLTHTDGYSVAVDNMKQRLEIPDLQYDNFDNSLNMTAYTKPFKTQVEFEATGTSKVDKDGNIENVSNILNKLDFGIIERPRENLVADKTISDIKITLANGQVLTEGDPRTEDLNYVKAMGIKQQGLEKQILVEMDSELLQGATVEVQYEVTITNNNEIDYDYGTYENYKDEFEAQGKFEYDKYIVKNEKADYYYYGKRDGLSEEDKIKATIEFVDYMSNEVKLQSAEWKSKKLETLYAEDNKLISDETYEAAKNYTVMESASDEPITLAIGKSFEQSMKVSKVLSNEGNNTYDNNIEIIKIDGKTARTIQESQEGKQVPKSYKPGNYVPSLASGLFEQDDDRVKVMITPPTGITNYVITYVIAGLVGLIVIVAGIIFIKKKVLIK